MEARRYTIPSARESNPEIPIAYSSGEKMNRRQFVGHAALATLTGSAANLESARQAINFASG
jgi:hypothetical protein